MPHQILFEKEHQIRLYLLWFLSVLKLKQKITNLIKAIELALPVNLYIDGFILDFCHLTVKIYFGLHQKLLSFWNATFWSVFVLVISWMKRFEPIIHDIIYYIWKLNLNELSDGLKCKFCTFIPSVGWSWGNLFTSLFAIFIVLSSEVGKWKSNLNGWESLSSFRSDALSISERSFGDSEVVVIRLSLLIALEASAASTMDSFCLDLI